jgi:hypothetical protein
LSRAAIYAVIVLLALILSAIPAILWMDFVVPYSAYEVWQRRGQDLVFRLSPAAAAASDLDTEVFVFKLLVAPTLLPAWLGVPRPEYTRFAFPDDTVIEIAGIQPSRLAMQYGAVAAPAWSLLLALLYELARWIVTQSARSRR